MREIKHQFRRAIHCGIGVAYFIIRENPHVDFSRDIIHACTHDLSHDVLCDRGRAPYLTELIYSCKQKRNIINAVLLALPTAGKKYRDIDQLCELAANIYEREQNDEIKQAIYKRYTNEGLNGSEWCGEDALLRIDGITALKHIIQTRGQKYETDPNAWGDCGWGDGWRVKDFQEEHPHIEVYAELEQAGRHDVYINRYLDMIKPHKHENTRPAKAEKYTYERVKNNIDQLNSRPISPYRISDLSPADLMRLADDFEHETDPKKQELYLFVFTLTRYPQNHATILKIAQRRPSKSNCLTYFSCRALGLIASEDVRALAIERMTAVKDPLEYLYILIANYRTGDGSLIGDVISRTGHHIHDLGWPICEIYEANSTRECKEPLEKLYYKLNCGIIRHSVLKILDDNGVLSKAILKEMEYDCSVGVRELYKEIITRTGNG